MADRKMECKLPNGDMLVASYDGDRLTMVVSGSDWRGKVRTVFRRSYTNGDLTGDPVFDRPPEQDASDGEFIKQPAFFGPDE